MYATICFLCMYMEEDQKTPRQYVADAAAELKKYVRSYTYVNCKNYVVRMVSSKRCLLLKYH